MQLLLESVDPPPGGLPQGHLAEDGFGPQGSAKQESAQGDFALDDFGRGVMALMAARGVEQGVFTQRAIVAMRQAIFGGGADLATLLDSVSPKDIIPQDCVSQSSFAPENIASGGFSQSDNAQGSPQGDMGQGCIALEPLFLQDIPKDVGAWQDEP
ncbi:hypothetical protein N657DRAFT_461825 [Parathielavia appendiculata]|uniref:Uncharacterized protein n=1 Tax=Parathielavia appendiculata TaxID=2587402 RepID=A0AAN6TZX8_9PEZI|nr:hypothetical protein N657DRAFT_461825 [Parathielavia appendiculata]